MNSFFRSLIPFLSGILATFGGILISRDANSTGADDAVGQIAIALAPVVPDVSAGHNADANATLKAMRAIEQTAHNYRVQVGDPTLNTV